MNLKSFSLIILGLCIFPVTGCTNMGTDEDTSKPLPEYTREYAREWEHIKEEHIPVIQKNAAPDASALGGQSIRVTVPLKNPSPGHYIEVIGVADQNKKTLHAVRFTRDTAVFTAVIPVDASWDLTKVKVFAKCNLHDTWTAGYLSDYIK